MISVVGSGAGEDVEPAAFIAVVTAYASAAPPAPGEAERVVEIWDGNTC